MIHIITDWFSDESKAGGPVVSIKRLITFYKSLNLKSRVVSSNVDIDGTLVTKAMSDSNIIHVNRNILSRLYFFGNMRHKIDSNDVIYFQSFFSFYSTIIPLLLLCTWTSRKCILAPRGELYKGALDIKPCRKKIWLMLFNILYRHKVIFHATSEQEKLTIEENCGAYSIIVCQNIPPQIPALDVNYSEKNQNILKVVFLSRLVEKKNLDFLIRAVSLVKKPLCLDIYGDFENQHYKDLCYSCAKDAPENVSINFKGFIAQAEVQNVLKEYDLFALPTRGENFGHVIAEALSVGVSCVLSEHTPWTSSVCSSVCVGLSLELTVWAHYIEHFTRPSSKTVQDVYQRYLCEIDLAPYEGFYSS